MISSFKQLTAVVKTVLFLAAAGIASSLFLAMKMKQRADDIWKQLGITLPQAQQDINNSFIYGRFQYTGAKNAGNIVMGDRVAMIHQLVAYAKNYYNSKDFKTAYSNYRTRVKPQEPVRMPVTAESIRAQEKLRLEKALKVAEEGLTSSNPKIKNGAPTRIENIKKELAALDDPNNPVVKRRLDDADRSYQYALKRHAQDMQKFETEYPEDPKFLLKKRLQQMLDLTENIDYTAELKDANKVKIFVNPEYEKKPKEWKLAFRAGKATTDAVRAAAQQWLKELQ